MSMLNDINQAEQRIAKLQREDALKKIKKRKLDTRRKIEWGGLVVKSKMNQYPTDVILGALMVAYEEIKQLPESKALFEGKGEKAFLASKVDKYK